MNECSPHKEDIILGPKAKSLRERQPIKEIKKKMKPSWAQSLHPRGRWQRQCRRRRPAHPPVAQPRNRVQFQCWTRQD
jgi:hypothetical protein